MNGVGRGPKTDFFERLIDRALGVDGGIAPRLRSLFEPEPQTAPGSNLLEEPAHDAPGQDPMEPDRGPRDMAVQPTGKEPAPIASPQRPVLVDAPIAGASPEPAMSLAAAPLAALNADDAGDPVGDKKSPPPRAVATAPLASYRDDSASPRAEHAPISLPIALVRRRDPPEQSETAASDAPMPPQLVPDSRVTIERVFATPSPATHGLQADDRYTEPSPAPAAPTVNITIGRVEVRAVSAPSPRPRAEARGPQPLGLDEYLKRRGAR